MGAFALSEYTTFLLFQLTVNVAACFLVLAGAFMGTESPLTVTQMLWVNLIMDTFAAMALASLPPSEKVMRIVHVIGMPLLSIVLWAGISWCGWFLLCVAVGIALYLRTC